MSHRRRVADPRRDDLNAGMLAGKDFGLPGRRNFVQSLRDLDASIHNSVYDVYPYAELLICIDNTEAGSSHSRKLIQTSVVKTAYQIYSSPSKRSGS